MNILIFGGTTEGRELSRLFSENGYEITLAVATEYGRSLIEREENICIHAGRLDLAGMIDLLSTESFQWVIDATHPYADVVTENIKAACSAVGIRYVRLLREFGKRDASVFYVSNVEEAVSYLKKTKGNIFLTTGSKSLDAFTEIPNFSKRIFARMIPMEESIKKALALGYQNSHLICMQGPFSMELNREMLKTTHASYLVTKDSGDVGGFEEKLQAAAAVACEVIVISRPSDEIGFTKAEIAAMFRFDKKSKEEQ